MRTLSLDNLTTLMILEFKVNKPINEVFPYLSDMQLFCSVHPVIYKIEPKNNKNYIIHEILKFGSIPFSFTYPAKVSSFPDKNHILIQATVLKLIKIELDFQLEQKQASLTYIKETVTFKSLLPVKFLLRRVFKKQHDLLFKKIESL